MAATSLKLPDELKRRINRLASRARKTPHAFMVDTLAKEAERGELQQQFAIAAAESEQESLASGKSHPLDESFKYLVARMDGKRVRRPKPRSWRGSK